MRNIHLFRLVSRLFPILLVVGLIQGCGKMDLGGSKTPSTQGPQNPKDLGSTGLQVTRALEQTKWNHMQASSGSGTPYDVMKAQYLFSADTNGNVQISQMLTSVGNCGSDARLNPHFSWSTDSGQGTVTKEVQSTDLYPVTFAGNYTLNVEVDNPSNCPTIEFDFTVSYFQ